MRNVFPEPFIYPIRRPEYTWWDGKNAFPGTFPALQSGLGYGRVDLDREGLRFCLRTHEDPGGSPGRFDPVAYGTGILKPTGIVTFIGQNVIYSVQRRSMKKNTFYLVIGCIALILLALFWYSVEIHMPPLIEIAFIIGIGIIYLARRNVTDLIEDERSAKITEKAAVRTFQVFWVGFCAISIGAVMQILYVPTFPHEFSKRPPEIFSPRMMGYVQLGLLCLMIFLYVGFRIYYARKYGDWETDEE
jgi:uncharacterized membrane protein